MVHMSANATRPCRRRDYAPDLKWCRNRRGKSQEIAQGKRNLPMRKARQEMPIPIHTAVRRRCVGSHKRFRAAPFDPQLPLSALKSIEGATQSALRFARRSSFSVRSWRSRRVDLLDNKIVIRVDAVERKGSWNKQKHVTRYQISAAIFIDCETESSQHRLIGYHPPSWLCRAQTVQECRSERALPRLQTDRRNQYLHSRATHH